MNNSNNFLFFNLEPDRPDLPENKRTLYRTVYAILYHLPLLSLFIGVGVGLIYWLGYSGLLDQNEPRLLIVASIAIVTTLLMLPVIIIVRRGQLELAAFLLLVINSCSSAAQVFVWQGIVWIFLVIAMVPVLIYVIQRGLSLNYRAAGIFFGIAIFTFVYLIDQNMPFPRIILGDNLTPIAALAIYIMIVTAMSVMTVLESLINFRTISGRLATTFTFVALLSSIALLVIVALANLFFDRQRIFTELNAASKVRADQVGVALDNLERDVTLTFSDPSINQLIQAVHDNPVGTKNYQDAFDKLSAFSLNTQTQNSRYQEVLLINDKGNTIFSTSKQNIGVDFSTYIFYQNTIMGINYSIENQFPTSFDQASVILVKPVYQGGKLMGALAVRENFDSLKQILSANTGIGTTAETYLVGLSSGLMIPLSNTRKNIPELNTQPAEQALMYQSERGSGIWDNYTGAPVLGSYIRIPALKAVVIAEIEQTEVTQRTLNVALTNAIIGIFTLLLTFTIVFLTSRSIGLPIVDLADKATNLANGDLATRMQTTRQDEIGTLSTSFNSMADELQNLVRNLESKVEDRTQELRKQSNYLRVAAEVARDATTSQNLDELLNRASQLVLDRFGFYHTGIFLLDQRKEFAILRASPTPAGQEMLGRNHKLKVGQVGIVGNVAQTGEPRVALDTAQDATYFKNPSLPDTRSEMALPLKVNNEMIGVLDVQSEKPNAFTQDEISILQVMADQLALAIQRVQLSQEQENNLRQLERAYQQFTFSSWNKIAQNSSFQPGYAYDGMNLSPLLSLPSNLRDTLAKGKSVMLPLNRLDPNSATLAVPLKLRNQVIGVLNIQFNSQMVSGDTINLMEEAANRLANALENARLFSETQKAAERERTVSQITSKIRSTNDPKEMIQIALNELKQTLQLHDARILPFTPPQKLEKS